jgi:hypothetical protein
MLLRIGRLVGAILGSAVVFALWALVLPIAVMIVALSLRVLAPLTLADGSR